MRKLCFVKEDHLFLFIGGEDTFVFLKIKMSDISTNGWHFDKDGCLQVTMQMGRHSSSLVVYDKLPEECQ